MLSEFTLGLRLLVKTYYGQPHRFYHTMDHVESMLDGYHKYFGSPSDAEHVAILYHDAIYNPWQAGNEESSVELMYIHSKLYYPKYNCDTLEKAAAIILDTKHNGTPVSECSKRVVDLDMMILGKSQEIYDKYVRNTRKEYIKYSDEEWNIGRAKVLQSFLDMPRIYLTDVMFNAFEEKARQNILRELESINATGTN